MRAGSARKLLLLALLCSVCTGLAPSIVHSRRVLRKAACTNNRNDARHIAVFVNNQNAVRHHAVTLLEEAESGEVKSSIWTAIGGLASVPITLLNSVFQGGDTDDEKLQSRALVVLLPIGAIVFVLALSGYLR